MTHFYEPSKGHGLAHDPFNAIIAPRPIGWVSSVSDQGIHNLAPYSFFNAFNYTPPIIGFASIGYKDTVRNIEQMGEFCWSLVSQSLVHAMNTSSAPVDKNIDEFELAGLSKGESNIVSVPRVQESLVSMECKLSQILQLNSANGDKLDTWVVFGEVVGVHIAPSTLLENSYITELAKPVMRGGGPADYFTINENNKFQIQRAK